MPVKIQPDNSPRKGLILKQARETKGLSLEMVHEATKVPMDALKAIEEGYTIRTLSPFYYRGFLKIYAKYLGVTISDVVEDYQPEKLPPHIIEKKKETTPVIKFTPIVAPRIKDWVIKGLVALIALLVVVKIIGVITHKKSAKTNRPAASTAQAPEKKKAAVSKAAVMPERKKESQEKTATSPKESSQSATGTSSPAESAVKKIDLAVRAKKDCWLQVKVDDGVVFRSTLRKGAVETWAAKRSIEISGKDISDLEFELNGKIIGPLGKENRKAKKVVIDQNGFSVKQ